MQDDTRTTEAGPHRHQILRSLPILAIAAAAVLGVVFLRDWLSFEALARHRETLLAARDAHYLPMLLGFFAAYVAIVALSLPGAAIATLTGGFLFGLFPGIAVNAAAATLGATAIFLAARAGFGERLATRIDAQGGAVARLKAGLREDEISYLLAMRLIPAVPFFVANLVPALIGVPLRRYVWTTFVGILPGGAVYTWVGAGLGEVFARGETPDLGIVFEPMVLGPILGLAALSLAPAVVKRVRRAR